MLSCGQCLSNAISTECQDCNAQCLTCYGPQPTQCYKCKQPYYFTTTLSSCTLTCPLPYFGIVTTAQCTSICPIDTWGQPINRLCLASCPDPYYMDQSSRACVKTCPTSTYTYQRTCYLCNSRCSTCTNGTANDCIFCAEGFYKNNGQCGPCPDALYPNANLRICDDYLTYTLSILETVNDQQKVVIEIDFSEQIQSNTLNIAQQISVTDVNSIYYSMYLNEIELYQKYTVTLIFTISHRQTDVDVNFRNSVTSQLGTPVLASSAIQSLVIPAQFIVQSSEQSLLNINKILILAYLGFYAALLIICILLRTQKRMFFLILQNLQTIQLMLLLNFVFSTPIQDSLHLLDPVNIKPLPVLGLTIDGVNLSFFGTDIPDQYPDNNLKLESGYYYSFIANGGLQLFGVIAIAWLIWLLCFIMHNLYQIKNKIETIKIFRALYEFCNSMIVRIHEVLFYPLMVMFILQMWGYNFQAKINIASFVLAIIVFLYYMLILRVIYSSQFSEEQADNMFGEFYADYKKANDLKKNFQLFGYLIKFLYVAALVLLEQYPYVQFSIAFTFQIGYFIITVLKYPYQRDIMNFTSILGQLINIGLFITVLIQQYRYQETASSITVTNSEVDKLYECGFAFVIQLQILLGMFALLFLYNKAQDYSKFLENKPNWGKKFLNRMEKIVFSDKADKAMET